MSNQNEQQIMKRMEVLKEALDTAFDALLEIRAEERLITYLLFEGEKKKDEA